ncbi:hypothetical protein [Kutzneria chonburiensis]|uniref:Uncharacterized protein n=1 Tax=Kutzneria chonburiensis TaxID=1483604 RepID=A0ABV6N2X2_9PSEU|nr:hypothetical protein [Kutzneria chonburiensis]
MDPIKALDDRLNALRDNLVTTATVSGTSGTKVIVTMQGASLTLPRLTSYTPTVGDVVIVLTAFPGAWLVLGKPA